MEKAPGSQGPSQDGVEEGGRDRPDREGRDHNGSSPHPAYAGFYRLPIRERRARLSRVEHLPGATLRAFEPASGLTPELADGLVENVVGVHALPLGVCMNLLVDGVPRVVPMAIEEPSVVAAASHAAKLLRPLGGVRTAVAEPLMEGQVQILDVPDIEAARAAIEAATGDLLEQANRGHARLCAAGGGLRDIRVRVLPPTGPDDPLATMLIVHLVVDVRDAMGANAVNSMCEELAPKLQSLSRGRVRLRILTNLCARRTVSAEGAIPRALLDGDGGDVAEGIVEASIFAERDPHRAATHNKGIMNGVDAVLVALGQDWRAVEAGAHAFAARSGQYGPLATWRLLGDRLQGRLVMPMAVGTVGGTVRCHPTVKAALRLAGIDSAACLASAAAAVGLCQNLGALRALAAEGIQDGHLRMHARHVCIEAGICGEDVDRVARILAGRRRVDVESAREVYGELKGSADGEVQP